MHPSPLTRIDVHHYHQQILAQWNASHSECEQSLMQSYQTKTYLRVLSLFWESFPLTYHPTFQVWPFNIHTRTEWLMSFLINGFEWKEGSLIKPFSQVTARTMVEGAPGSHWPHQHKGTIYFHWYSRCCFTYFSSDPKHMLPCFYSMYHRILFRVICAWQVEKIHSKYILTFPVLGSAQWKLIHRSRIQDQKASLFIKSFDHEAVYHWRCFKNTYKYVRKIGEIQFKLVD